MPDIGDLVGEKYRLERLLGRGGMATVFEAVHVHIGKRAAIKFLRADLWTDTEQLNRFHREARAAAAVGHEGIIDIYDLGVSDDGAPYLVMELLQGHSLGDRLALEGRLAPPRASYVACQVLSALEAAHRAGVVHRDLKPDNIYLIDRGAALPGIKLLDFGISRIVGLGSADFESIRLTQTGALIGTPVYMSPEQAQGMSDIDHRSDIYSAAAVLYECLTGRPPLTAANYNALIARILTETVPPPSRWCSDMSPELEGVVLKGLAKEREYRYQNAADMLSDLVPFLDDGAESWIVLPERTGEPEAPIPSPTPTPSPLPTDFADQPTVAAPAPGRRGVARPASVAVLIAVVILSAVWAFWGSSGEDPTEARESPAETTEEGGSGSNGTIAASVNGTPQHEEEEDENEPTPTPPEPAGAEARAEADAGEGPPATQNAEPRTPAAEAGARPRAPRPRPPRKTRDERVRGRLGTAIRTEYE